MRRGLRSDLRASTGDGLAFSVMVGAGETYVPAFALALGLGEVVAGWIVTLPLLAGAALQLVSPWAVRRLGAHKRWVVLCAVLQAAGFGLYVYAAVRGSIPATALFAIATLYWAAGLATGPAWNAWIGALVPARLRARFFAHRNRWVQSGVLIGLVGAGVALQAGTRAGVVLEVFAGLFAVAGFSRAISAGFLMRQRRSDLPADPPRAHPFAWLRGAAGREERRLLLYMLAVQLAMQVAGPFFTPYMLAELEFSYVEFLAVIATSFATKALVMPTLGALAARMGSTWLLRLAGIGIVPLAALWMVSDSLAWLIAVQVIAGVIWASWELCTFLLLFEHIPEARRTSVLTGFNFANASAAVAGALAGGALLEMLSTGRDAYHALFMISSVLRVVTFVFLFRLVRTVFVTGPLVVRTLGVRPNAVPVDVPVIASIEEHER